MNFGVKAREDLDEADHLDNLNHMDEPPDDDVAPTGLNFRAGGTDLFRGVLVVLAALAVGAFIVTQSLDDTEDESSAATSGAETDDGSDAAAALDSAGSDEMAEDQTDPAMTSDDAMTDTSDPAAPAADDAGTATTTASAGETTAPEATSTSTSLADAMTPRAPDEVAVVVLNATDQKGIAGKGTELLDLSSYNTAAAGNVTDDNFGRGSVILYREGYQADAIAVAQVFADGLEGLVQPYDETAPPADDIGAANVIVILGIDDAIPIP